MKDFKIELRWGILFSLAFLIWMFLEEQLGWHGPAHISMAYFFNFLIKIVLLVVFLFLGIRAKRNDFYEGVISWKKGFVSGVMIAVIITILSPLIVFFIYHYISPDYFDNLVKSYQNHRSSNPEIAKKARELFNMKVFMIQAVVFDLSFGFSISALLAFLLRTKK